MPNINIREVDYTVANSPEYNNFAVVVPGKVETSKASKAGIMELYSQEDFIDKVGKVAAADDQYGNQIAYELLGLGYPVIYVPIEDAAALATPDWCAALKDKALYDFRYIITGLLKNSTAANNVISTLAAERGDCIALVDIAENVYENNSNTTEAINAAEEEAAKLNKADKNTAIFTPSVTYIMPEDDIYKNNKFPASFHYLACAASAARKNFAEWYAVAGYTRGISSNFTISNATVNFGDLAANAFAPRRIEKTQTISVTTANAATYGYTRLVKKAATEEAPVGIDQGESYYEKNKVAYKIEATESDIKSLMTIAEKPVAVQVEVPILPRAINAIIKLRTGYYIWGNRTAHALETTDLVASHFLNIRQLCTSIKKQAYVACRQLTFDPNSGVLWINFTSRITPILERMKADQGIKDYRLLQVATDTKAMFKAKIRIIPIEAVEDFDITLSLEDSFGQVQLQEENI